MTGRLRRRILPAIAAVGLCLGAATMVVQSAGAIGPLGALLARTAAQTIGIKIKENREREAVNERRDRELNDVNAEEAGLSYKEQQGWISPEAVARERARLAEKRKAIEERALRERQIVSFQARRKIDAKLKSALNDALRAATGASPRDIELFTALLHGENPLDIAIAAAAGGQGVGPRDPFVDLRNQLERIRTVASAIGGADTTAIRARLNEALREATGLAEGAGPPTPDEIERLRQISADIDKAAERLREIRDELFPDSSSINRERFSHDERWVAWNASVEWLDSPAAKKGLTASILRRSSDRVEAISGEAGINLTEEQIEAIAFDVLSAWIDDRLEGGLEPGEVIDLDRLVRTAINEALATAGLDPLPEPTPEDDEPSRRVFKGDGTWSLKTPECKEAGAVSVGVTLVLDVDGKATLALTRWPVTVLIKDGRGIVVATECNGQAAGRIYSGSWRDVDGTVTAEILIPTADPVGIHVSDPLKLVGKVFIKDALRTITLTANLTEER